jgi:hypothetical protein
MKTLVCLLEEPSAEEMLKGLLPKILPEDMSPVFHVFEGKQDLEKRMTGILRAWQAPRCHFLVIRDQDSGDCTVVKERLAALCQAGGKADAVVRIACRELESFFLGDLAAVETGLSVRGLSAHQGSRKFRAPDDLGNPTQELSRLTNGRYQKVAGSRAIGPHLALAGNRSHSFNVLLAGIRKVVEAS